MGCGEIEENGIINLDRRWRNNVPKADVYLDRNACSIDGRIRLDADASICKIFSDGCCGESLYVEDNAIVGNSGRTDGFESV